MTELEQKREELNQLSTEHSAAVVEMNEARAVLDQKITKVRQLNDRLKQANEEYMRLELATTH